MEKGVSQPLFTHPAQPLFSNRGMQNTAPKPTPAQKLRIASALYQTARKVKAAAIARMHPDWTIPEVAKETARRLFLIHD
jgi:hypothetical protein